MRVRADPPCVRARTRRGRPTTHVVNRRHALRADVGHCRVEGAILELRWRFRHDGIHELRRVVLQHTRGLAARGAHDGPPATSLVARVMFAASSAAEFTSDM